MKTIVLTNKGVSVVRAAQSKFKKVTVLDVVTSTHFENTANELATKSGTWYNGAVGQVKAVKSGGNHLKVQVTFPATPYAQPLKSVGIRILAEGDNRPYILYAESDGNSAVTLGSEFTCEYEIPINVGVQTIEPEGDYPDPEACGSSIDYDSQTKKIELKNAEGETLSEIDATAFIKDGMVNNVAIVDDYLVITFNTDAGKEAINIPMSSFFDSSAYYTKTEINDGYYTKTEINENLNNYCTIDAITRNYYTKKEIDANHYTKSEVNAGYYSKSEIDGGYIANASYNSATNTLTLSSKDGSKQIALDLS